MAEPKKIKYMQTPGPPASEQVNFRLGYPSPSSLPIDAIRKAFAHKLDENDPEFFMYNVGEGYAEFREALATFLSKYYGFDVDAKELMACNGSSGGLDLVLKMLTSPGDIVFTENPTYFLAMDSFNDYGLITHHVQMDEDGLNIETLEKMLEEHKPKILYTIPVAHNPTGRTTSDAKRKKIVALAQKHKFIIVADEVYQLLTFKGVSTPPPMSFYDLSEGDRCVVSIGSFSKIVAPALRLGWLQGDEKFLKQILKCGLIESGGCLNPIMCGAIHSAIILGLLDECVEHARERLQIACTRMQGSIARHFPKDVTCETPSGGYFLICKLPSGMQSTDLLKEALKEKVCFLPGTTFGQGFESFMRLSFSFYSPDEIELGVQRLAKAIGTLRQKQFLST